MSDTRRNFMQAVAGLALSGIGRFGAAAENGELGRSRATKILRLGLARPKGPLYPVSGYDHTAMALSRHLSERLCDQEALEVHPVLATGWRAREDETVWTFDLRPSVKLHNGRALTTDDVAASLARLDAGFTAMEVGAQRLEFSLQEPDPHFPWRLSSLNCESAIAKESFQDTGGLVGTGPFRLEEYDVDRRAVLVPHRDYWGRSMFPPSMPQRVEFIFYDRLSDAYEAALEGEVDRFLI
jgi:MarR-like DNA-binding transcriptional regulator SgrR of sgrS sRNA